MSEFDLIRRLQAVSGAGANGLGEDAVVIGIGDDAAVLEPAPTSQLVATADTLVAGVHFAHDVDPEDLGHKALAVNLSDLAAMGAVPAWHLLCIAGPEPEGDWIERLGSGMARLASSAGSRLVGGDITGGAPSITVTALGQVPRGQALLRSTARDGDLVVVSGVPGLAARALWAKEADVHPDARERLLRPEPRLALGTLLRGRATACIDVSDGLAADLGHILSASGLAAELWLDRLPEHPAFDDLERTARWNLQLGGGDDYELCFTVPERNLNDLSALAGRAGVPLTVVGRVRTGSGLAFLKPDGSGFSPERMGWDHFGPDTR